MSHVLASQFAISRVASPRLRLPLAALLSISMASSGHAFSFTELYNKGFDQLNKQIYSAIGSLKVCAANELKPWLSSDVVPAFKLAEKGLKIGESDLIFEGSGELADRWNDGNKDSCDIIILGSDVSALRGVGFERTKALNIAYTPTVFIGVKDKLAAAREHLNKAPADALSCSELALVAKKGRMSRLKPGSNGKLAIEMSTSNSGQTGYVSCLYSELGADSPKDVEAILSAPASEPKRTAVRNFMSSVVFEQASSRKVVDLFIDGEGLGVGAAHLVIGTYESYLPEITKVASANNIELEVVYPPVSILNNFPAFVIAPDGSPAANAAKALLQLATSMRMQQHLLKYGMRPARQGLTLPSYMNVKIEVGDSPRNRKDLRQLWDIVAKLDSVKLSGVTANPM
jgi:Bacterial extracellular solute-binding protein